MIFHLSSSDFQHRREYLSQQESASDRQQETLGPGGVEAGREFGPEPWSVGGIWISRGESFAKMLRWQKMLHVPRRGKVWGDSGGPSPGRRIRQGFWIRRVIGGLCHLEQNCKYLMV